MKIVSGEKPPNFGGETRNLRTNPKLDRGILVFLVQTSSSDIALSDSTTLRYLLPTTYSTSLLRCALLERFRVLSEAADELSSYSHGQGGAE